MWAYIVELFSRAQQNKALTTHERAVLKALQGALFGIIVDAAPQLFQIAAGTAHFNFNEMSLSALFGAIILGAVKLWLAQSDPQVGALLDAYAKQKETQAISQVIQAGPGDLTVPAMHFVVPTQSVIVAQSGLPVASPSPAAGLTMAAVAKAFSGGSLATGAAPASDPHGANTSPQFAVDKTDLPTGPVPAVRPMTTNQQFQPLSFAPSDSISAAPTQAVPTVLPTLPSM